MTDRINENCSLLKSDRLGRARFTASQRNAFLDAYEKGALSGPQFAQVHGLKYQTFASWRQKRQRQKNMPGIQRMPVAKSEASKRREKASQLWMT
jgi:hypothetical protein